MAAKTILEQFANIYAVASLSPLIFGGAALTLLKPLYRTEDEIKKDTDKIREALIERICLSYDRLVPTLSDAFNDIVGGQPTRDDVRSILRGDGKGKPDLCYEHFKSVFMTSSKLMKLDTIRSRYRFSHGAILSGAILGFSAFGFGAVWEDLKGYVSILGLLLFGTQALLVFMMRRLSYLLEEIERN